MAEPSVPLSKPNRRGLVSREAALDAAERVMAASGYEGASVAEIVRESGLPASSIYHYFGSKEGMLLAVMERGAERFFEGFGATPAPESGDELRWMEATLAGVIERLEREPHFLRLLIVFAVQPPPAVADEVRAVVGRVRSTALHLLQVQLTLVLGVSELRAVELARSALAMVDGAFVASQADPELRLDGLLRELPGMLLAVSRARA